MKKIWLIILLASVLTTSLFSQHKRFGLGIVLGEPTGFTAKLWLSRYNSINGAFAWSILHEEKFYIHIDHVFHYYGLFDIQTGELPLHLGVGGRLLLKKGEEGNVGFRIPLGFTYIMHEVPVEFFGEIVPVVNLIPETDMDIDGGIGFRYFF